jgi:type I restriction enzyme S subunit
MARYKFDQIAFNSTDKKKPVDEDKEHYIGLEHLDSGSLQVTRWGSEIAPKGEKLLMKKGDVLFGKRRAYQKKVAIAPFDGIFSAHGMVLRPKTEVIDPDFFPLFIASDYFLDAAIKISVGSLSPTINWRNLKELEFDIPSLSVQKKLANVLWAINDTKGAYEQLIQETDELVKSQFIEMFGDEQKPITGVAYKKLGDIATYINGYAFKPDDWGTEGLPIIRIQNLTGSGEDYNYYNGEYPEKVEVNDGDILISWSASLGVYLWNQGKALLNQHIFRVEFDKLPVDKRFFMYAVQQKLNEMGEKAHGSTMHHIVKKDFDNTRIAFPSMNKQKQFSEIAAQSDKSKFELNESIKELDAMYKRIIKDNLG